MISERSIKNCCGCSACSNACPQKCIQLKRNANGILHPSIDESLCVSCGLCNKVCPLENVNDVIISVSVDESRKCFYCRATDDTLRGASSSGGVFPVLAQKIIEMGGNVYAACFEDGFYDVQHLCIENSSDLSKAYGAKYIQSDLKLCFSEIKKKLEKNVTILFVGTPCQVCGLKLFLGKHYNTLYTIDMICHGVPGNAFWQKYLNYRNKRSKAIDKVSFRDKRNGWLHYGISIDYQDGSTFFSEHNRDPYMLAYLRNYSLSETCFTCQFRGNNRHSDITIGDAWGADLVAPQLFDDRGLSAILVHTEIGEWLLEQVKERLLAKQISYESIEKYNSSVEIAAVRPKEFEQFNSDCTTLAMNSIVRKYFYFSPIVRIKDFTKRLLVKKKS